MQDNPIRIIEVSFSEVYYKWSNCLWPGRTDVKPISSIDYDLTINMNLYNNEVKFFALVNDTKEIIGVNSALLTSNNTIRSRGLWVDEKYRGNMLSKHLFSAVENFGVENNANRIWSLPREEALNVYENAGFQIIKKVEHVQMDYGVNFLAVKNI